MVTIKEFISVYEEYAPTKLKMGNDPIGLHFGHPDNKITKLMTTLDIRPEVVEEAIENDVDFILAHHPPIFKPVSKFDESDPQQKMYANIIRHNIGVYASHTNLDVVSDGLNDWLAEALGLKDIQTLSKTYTSSHYKLTFFVPYDDVDKVLEATHKVGAGQVGDDYKNVSYAVEGEGRFTPTNNANPTIGEVDKEEIVEEKRIEMLVKEEDISHVIQAIKDAHPYEEPVYDIYKLEFSGDTEGIGRIGELETEKTLPEFLKHVAKSFNVDGLRYVEPYNQNGKTIKKVALCGGDGGSFYKDAVNSNADVYITGDVYYHTAHDMQADGLTVVDPGHNIEAICIPKLAVKVNKWKKEHDWKIDVIKSTVNTEPFKFFK